MQRSVGWRALVAPALAVTALAACTAPAAPSATPGASPAVTPPAATRTAAAPSVTRQAATPSPEPVPSATAAPAAGVAPTPTPPPAGPTPHPAPPSTPVPTPAPTPPTDPCTSVDCVPINPCRGGQCLEDDPPDPDDCPGYDCIEWVPNAFEHGVWMPGERIDWDSGLFVLEVETGRMEAYRLRGSRIDPTPRGDWVVVRRRGASGWNLALHRETGSAVRWWPHSSIGQFLFEEPHPWTDGDDDWCGAWPDPLPPWGQPGPPAGIPCAEADVREAPASQAACQGSPSPDGRYVAQQWGEPESIGKTHGYPYVPLHTESSVVFADAETCEPLFGVRSATAVGLPWRGRWLSNSEGFVVRISTGHAVVRVRPEPEIVALPPAPLGAPWSEGPLPAPTGDGRYFAYGLAGVYDAEADRWILTGFGPQDRGVAAWGESHEEVNYWLGLDDGGVVYIWSLGEPEITMPPFEELIYRVTGTGSCLNLRAAPDVEGSVLRCLPDGTRVAPVVPPPEAGTCAQVSWRARSCYPATRRQVHGDSSIHWVYVRTEEGREGWVAHHAGAHPGHPRYLERIPPER